MLFRSSEVVCPLFEVVHGQTLVMGALLANPEGAVSARLTLLNKTTNEKRDILDIDTTSKGIQAFVDGDSLWYASKETLFRLVLSGDREPKRVRELMNEDLVACLNGMAIIKRAHDPQGDEPSSYSLKIVTEDGELLDCWPWLQGTHGKDLRCRTVGDWLVMSNEGQPTVIYYDVYVADLDRKFSLLVHRGAGDEKSVLCADAQKVVLGGGSLEIVDMAEAHETSRRAEQEAESTESEHGRSEE